LYTSRTEKLYNKNTQRRNKKNVKSNKLTKRSFNQTNERLTRPNNTTIPKRPTNARIPNNNQIRKNFGVYFGPSTIYPLLGTLEKKGYVKSEWNMSNERPRKIYSLTSNGQSMLNFTEESLNLICRKISIQTNAGMTVESPTQSTVSMMAKKGRSDPTNRLAFEMR